MSEAVTESPETYQPFAPAELSCPHAGWAMLRERSPVHPVDLPGSPMPIYLVTRRREIDFITQHTELFSNHPPAGMWRWPELHEPEVAAAFSACGRKPVNTLQSSDPPESMMYRRLIDATLSRRGVKDMAGKIDRIVAGLLDKIPTGQPVDFVDAFSVPLPLLMICVILGVPFEDAGFFRRYTDEFAFLVDPITPSARAAKAAETLAEGYEYLEKRIFEYRETPGDSLLSAIANARFGAEERPATMEESLSMAHVALIAGNETTRNALSSTMYNLVRRPDLWQRLKADPALIPEFVEEALRIAGPANTTPRTVLQDVEIGGVLVPKGSCLFMMWGSGSLDEETFPDAETFDIERKNKRHHTTFGVGIHFCAGMHLARAELITAVTQWLQRYEMIEFAVPEGEIQYEPIFAFHALGHLPLRFTAAA
jgi:cytochrome P450